MLSELRRRTIPIFFDMMQCEFMSQAAESGRFTKKNFSKVPNLALSAFALLRFSNY
jgi:hypothetical protein